MYINSKILIKRNDKEVEINANIESYNHLADGRFPIYKVSSEDDKKIREAFELSNVTVLGSDTSGNNYVKVTIV